MESSVQQCKNMREGYKKH